MTRLRFLAAAFALAGATAAPAQQPTPTFSSEVDLVTVDAVVIDDRGQPVTGLTRADFTVWEDGRRQEIVSFEAFGTEPPDAVTSEDSATPTDETPRLRAGRQFAVVLDDLGMTSDEVRDATRGASTFLERSLGEGDEVTLVTTSGDVWWSAGIPDGREDLQALLARVKGRYLAPGRSFDYMTEYEAFWIANREAAAEGPLTRRVIERWERVNVCDPRGGSCPALVRARATSIDGARRLRTRLVLQSVRRTINALGSTRGRKSLLLFSRGFLDDAGTEAREIAAGSREAGAAVYFIDTAGLVTNPGTPSIADAGHPPDPSDVGAMAFEESTLSTVGARGLADDTGGFSVRNTNDLAAGAARIAEESRVFYLLGFHPFPGKARGEWRKLRVDVAREGATVRARRGYALMPPGGIGARGDGSAKEPHPPPRRSRSAFDSAHETAIPLRARAFVFEPRGKEKTRVLVVAEFDSSGLTFVTAASGRSAQVEFSVTATHRDTGKVWSSDGIVEVRAQAANLPGWRSFTRELDLPAGVSQARVVVRDPVSSALGSVSHRFEVSGADVLRLSTPILTDRVARGSGTSAPIPAMAVHRTFRPSGELYCQFEVLGAARDSGSGLPRVSAGLELRTADGRVVRKAPLTQIAADSKGRLVRLIGIGVEGMEEGSYDLILEVRDLVGGGHIQRPEHFVLDREAHVP